MTSEIRVPRQYAPRDPENEIDGVKVLKMLVRFGLVIGVVYTAILHPNSQDSSGVGASVIARVIQVCLYCLVIWAIIWSTFTSNMIASVGRLVLWFLLVAMLGLLHCIIGSDWHTWAKVVTGIPVGVLSLGCGVAFVAIPV